MGLGGRVESAEKTLREALRPATAAALQVIDEFRDAVRRPDEIEIGFGVTLDGKLGGIIATAQAGTHLDVTLRWRQLGEAEGEGKPPGRFESDPGR